MAITGCRGFKAAGMAAGIKKKQQNDLGLIYSEVPATAAGVFTRNRVQAAPVLLDRERISAGACRAILVNSGNANCCTGERGLRDAVAMSAAAAAQLGVPEELVLVASTGVIGAPLPLARVEAAVPQLVRRLASDGWPELAAAIMTTDTVPKLVHRQGRLGGQPFTVTAVAKGAGMIRPDMATMLCFICTDAAVPADRLQAMLTAAVERSFNRITIDGDTSTNDTVLLLANGASGVAVQTAAEGVAFQQVLDDVAIDLARRMVKDGEGVTKLVEIRVTGAAGDADARAVADTVAHSNLVKTAFFGEDANWGRIIAAAGRAGVPVDPYAMDIRFDDVLMVKDGVGCGPEAEAAATRVLQQDEFVVELCLNMGRATASVLTCDFSVDYVRINADYRS